MTDNIVNKKSFRKETEKLKTYFKSRDLSIIDIKVLCHFMVDEINFLSYADIFEMKKK